MSNPSCRGGPSRCPPSPPAAKCCSNSRATKNVRYSPSFRRTKACRLIGRAPLAKPFCWWIRLRLVRDRLNDRPDIAPCALIVMGVSGSGKSTIAAALAERLKWTFEDGDRFHPKSNVAKMSAGHPLTDEDRRPWLQAIADEIDRVCEAGERAVIACSALKRAYRDILVHGRDDVRIVFLEGSQALIADRLEKRKGHFMPAGLLDSQFKTLEPPQASEHPITVSIDATVEEIVRNIA